MIAETKINEIVRKVAAKTLGSKNFSSATSTPMIDAQGDDALRITIVLKPGSIDRLRANDNEATIDTLTEIRRTLSEKGDDRFPFVEYRLEGEEEPAEEGDLREELEPEEDEPD